MVKHGGWAGLYDPNFPEVLELLETDEPLPERASRVFKLTPNLVAEVPLGSGLRVVVKDFGWRNFLHFWASPLSKSKALRSLQVATHLFENGLLTPRPIGAFEQRNEGLVKRAYFVTESLGETNSLRECLRLSPGQGKTRRRLLALLAEYVRQMHNCGLFHRDLTLGNFLIQGGQLYLVDLTRGRVKPRISALQRIEDIAKMELVPLDRLFFFKLYWRKQKGRELWYRLLCFRAALYQVNRRLRRLRRRVRRFL